MVFSRGVSRFPGRLPPATARSPKFAQLFTTSFVALAKVNVNYEDVLLSVLIFRDLFRIAENNIDGCTKKRISFFSGMNDNGYSIGGD